VRVGTANPVCIRVDYQLLRRGRSQKQSKVKSAPDVSEDPLQRNQMGLPWVVHIKADLLNNIGDVWSSKGKILQGTDETPEVCRVLNGNTIRYQIAVNWSGEWLALGHSIAVEDIKHILLLR